MTKVLTGGCPGCGFNFSDRGKHQCPDNGLVKCNCCEECQKYCLRDKEDAMAKAKGLVWIGVEFGGDFEVKACTALRDLSEVCNFSYDTAKRKTGEASFMIKGKNKERTVWMVSQVEVKKVSGRGKDNRNNFKLAEV